MDTRKMVLPVVFLIINVIFSYMYIEKISSESTQRFGVVGWIPVVLGIISFLYINKVSERKTGLLWVMQILNVLFIIFPLLTLIYFMTQI